MADFRDDRIKKLEAEAKDRRENRIKYFVPYPKQKAFLDLGATKRERLLVAGNQVGKSEVGAFELACHLSGNYPSWWAGRKFNHAVRCWAAGESVTEVREILQRKLVGEPGVPGLIGTGMIPRSAIIDTSLSRGASDAIDTVQVRHVSGGISTLSFKTYEQGRQKFQGATLHVVWLDEEPPQDIYTECLARIAATKGMLYTTYTPIKGMTDLSRRFISPEENSADRAYVQMSIQDALHISEADRATIIAGYPPHQRDARIRGIPYLGSGAVFPYTDAQITETLRMSDVPSEFAKLWGIDPGIGDDHPFGAVLIAWDRDADVIHVVHTVKLIGQLPAAHAFAMKQVGAAVPVGYPHDALGRDKASGIPLRDHYQQHGLLMLQDHATWPSGGYSTEAGILEMQERFATGRLKIAAHLSDLLEEVRMYHRLDDGNGTLAKHHDDLLSALRVAIMAKRHAKPVAFGSQGRRRGEPTQIARGIDDWDIHTGRPYDGSGSHGSDFDPFTGR